MPWVVGPVSGSFSASLTQVQMTMNSGVLTDSLGHVTAPGHQKMRRVHRFPFRTKALTPQGLGVLRSKLWLVIAKYVLPYCPWLKTISSPGSTVLSQGQLAFSLRGGYKKVWPLIQSDTTLQGQASFRASHGTGWGLCCVYISLNSCFSDKSQFLYSPVNSLHSNQNMDGGFYSVATYNGTLNKSQQ